MNEVFSRGPSLTSRLIIVLALSVASMLVDTKVQSFEHARTYLNSFVAPLQYIANLPGAMLNWSSEKMTSRQQLLDDNQQLTSEITLLREQLQRFDILQLENENLRRLLDAPIREGMHRMITELLAVDNNPYSHQIVVNKGAIDDVYIGQSVLDESGIVGQVVEVSTTNSRVLLISDVTHAIPVRVKRNNTRFIANGDGNLDRIQLQHVAHSADINEGDILVSSGLGKVFPEGYPVAQISKIVRDESRPFAQVVATPIAKLDRLKYLLLLWPAELAPDAAIPPSSSLKMKEATIQNTPQGGLQ